MGIIKLWAVLNAWIFIGIYFVEAKLILCHNSTYRSDLFTFWLSGWKFGCHLIKNFITLHSPVFIRYKQMLSLKLFFTGAYKEKQKNATLSLRLAPEVCFWPVYLFVVVFEVQLLPRSASLLSKRPLPVLKTESRATGF